MQRLIALKEELNGLAAVRVPHPQTHPLLSIAYGLSANYGELKLQLTVSN